MFPIKALTSENNAAWSHKPAAITETLMCNVSPPSP